MGQLDRQFTNVGVGVGEKINFAAPTNNTAFWLSANLVDPNETRKAYIAALRAADAHDFDALIVIARS